MFRLNCKDKIGGLDPNSNVGVTARWCIAKGGNGAVDSIVPGVVVVLALSCGGLEGKLVGLGSISSEPTLSFFAGLTGASALRLRDLVVTGSS